MHNIEESFRVKKPSVLVDYIAMEATKNYSSAQIFHALRGAGTAEGSERLTALGGSSLTRYNYINVYWIYYVLIILTIDMMLAMLNAVPKLQINALYPVECYFKRTFCKHKVFYWRKDGYLKSYKLLAKRNNDGARCLLIL